MAYPNHMTCVYQAEMIVKESLKMHLPPPSSLSFLSHPLQRYRNMQTIIEEKHIFPQYCCSKIWSLIDIINVI